VLVPFVVVIVSPAIWPLGLISVRMAKSVACRYREPK
jgi:hypothetical protein